MAEFSNTAHAAVSTAGIFEKRTLGGRGDNQ